MQNRRFWLAKLALLAVSTLVAILSIEGFIRATGRDRALLWEPDPVLGWRHIPFARVHWQEEGDGHVQINSLGLRDVDRALQKESGVFRIAVFGDSTTEAVQVDLEQTFTQLLERKLQQRGLRVQVLNFGVSGYGPLQEYLLYSQWGRRFNPDLVLQAVFLDNDVADGDRRLAAGQRGAPFLKRQDVGQFEIDDSQAIESSISYRRQPLYAIRKLSAIYRMLSAGRNRRMTRSVLQAGRDANGEVPRRFLLYEQPLAREWEDAWDTLERVITKFADTVHSDGATFAVVSVPAGQVVHQDVWEQLVRDYPAMSSRKWDVLSPERRLREMTERHQIPLIAPLDTFVRAASTDPLFFQRIGHLTPRGHEVMAAALEATLTDRELLKAASPVPK